MPRSNHGPGNSVDAAFAAGARASQAIEAGLDMTSPDGRAEYMRIIFGPVPVHQRNLVFWYLDNDPGYFGPAGRGHAQLRVIRNRHWKECLDPAFAGTPPYEVAA